MSDREAIEKIVAAWEEYKAGDQTEWEEAKVVMYIGDILDKLHESNENQKGIKNE